MKLLFIVNDLYGERGGGNRFSEELVSSLLERGHEVVCVVHEINDAVPVRQVRLLEAPLRYMANPLLVWRTARKLRRAIAKFQPDLIHILCEPYAAVFAFIRVSAPVVLSAHGTYAYIPHLQPTAFRRKISAALFHAAYRRFAGIASVSSYTQHWLVKQHAKRGITLPAVLEIISGGIRMSDGVLFTSHEISNPAELLSVGGVKARKGAIPALEMLAAYNARYSHPAVLRFVGSLTQDPPYVARAIARAEALGLTSSVYWEGQISDDELARRYARADAFVMLSVPEGNEFEGFGLVYLEANARGIPVVGAYGSGAEDAIANGTSGFLVHADNPAEGAATLHRLLTNRDTLSRSAYAWAQQHTWNTVAQKFETFYALVRKDA